MAASAHHGKHPRVAIVDDDRRVREQLGRLLRASGYDALEAPSGLRLLSLLEVDRPDAILLDVQMRWINGLELTRSLKANRSWRTIPVIIISGHTSDSDVAAGIAAGANAYLKKPLDSGELLALLAQLVAATEDHHHAAGR